jgi:hypothetical protein
MYIGVKEVVPQADYTLLLTFENNERKLFDVKPYLNKGVFQELKDFSMFQTARVFFDTVAWKNEVDLAPETLYQNSIQL